MGYFSRISSVITNKPLVAFMFIFICVRHADAERIEILREPICNKHRIVIRTLIPCQGKLFRRGMALLPEPQTIVTL